MDFKSPFHTLYLNVGAPSLLQNKSANFRDISLLTDYTFDLAQNISLSPAISFETFNNTIAGVLILATFQETISIVGGFDSYKYHLGAFFRQVRINYIYSIIAEDSQYLAIGVINSISFCEVY